MSSSHQHQDNQKKMTNVAIVRYKRFGKKFEIAAYRNMVTTYRNGIEKDLDEVLQIVQVFENVSRGIHANAGDLEKCFGTTDPTECCKMILMKGELQVSDKERQAEYESKFKDIATLVAGRCVNTNTHWPFPVTTIETAMRETIHFSVNPNKNTKQQAKEVEERLKEHLPLARARMHLKLSIQNNNNNKTLNDDFVKYCTSELEKIISLANGKIIIPSAPPPPPPVVVVDDSNDNNSDNDNSGSKNNANNQQVVLEVIVDPHLFRELENYVKQRPGSSLGIMQFNLQAANEADLEDVMHSSLNIGNGGKDLEKEEEEEEEDEENVRGTNSKKKASSKIKKSNKNSSNPNENNPNKREELNARQQIVLQDVETSKSTSVDSTTGSTSSLKCTSCGVDFGNDRNLQRTHYKSDFHTYNLKLKATSLPSVSLAEFNNMSDEDKKAVLFDWKC